MIADRPGGVVERVADRHAVRVEGSDGIAAGQAGVAAGDQPLVVEERPDECRRGSVGDRVVGVTLAVQVLVDEQGGVLGSPGSTRRASLHSR